MTSKLQQLKMYLISNDKFGFLRPHLTCSSRDTDLELFFHRNGIEWGKRRNNPPEEELNYWSGGEEEKGRIEALLSHLIQLTTKRRTKTTRIHFCLPYEKNFFFFSMNTDLQSGSHHLHSICHHKSVYSPCKVLPALNSKSATRTPLNKIGTKWVRDSQDKSASSSLLLHHAWLASVIQSTTQTWKLRLRWILLESSAKSFTGINGTDTRQ